MTQQTKLPDLCERRVHRFGVVDKAPRCLDCGSPPQANPEWRHVHEFKGARGVLPRCECGAWRPPKRGEYA